MACVTESLFSSLLCRHSKSQDISSSDYFFNLSLSLSNLCCSYSLDYCFNHQQYVLLILYYAFHQTQITEENMHKNNTYNTLKAGNTFKVEWVTVDHHIRVSKGGGSKRQSPATLHPRSSDWSCIMGLWGFWHQLNRDCGGGESER